MSKQIQSIKGNEDELEQAFSQLNLDKIHPEFKPLLQLIDASQQAMSESFHSNDSMTPSQLQDYIQVFTHQVNKFCIFMNQQPDAAIIQSQIQDLSHHFRGFVNVLHLLKQHKCSQWHVEFDKSTRNFFIHIIQLMQHVSALLTDASIKLNASIVGKLLDHTGTFSTYLNNSGVAGKHLQSHIRMSMDAANEINDMIASIRDKEAAGTDDGDDEEFDDFDDELDMEYTDVEAQLIQPCKSFVEHVINIMKVSYMHVLKIKDDVLLQDAQLYGDILQFYDDQCMSFSLLSSRLDTLVSSLYPPYDVALLNSTVEELMSAAVNVLCRVIERCAKNEETWTVPGKHACTHDAKQAFYQDNLIAQFIKSNQNIQQFLSTHSTNVSSSSSSSTTSSTSDSTSTSSSTPSTASSSSSSGDARLCWLISTLNQLHADHQEIERVLKLQSME